MSLVNFVSSFVLCFIHLFILRVLSECMSKVCLKCPFAFISTLLLLWWRRLLSKQTTKRLQSHRPDILSLYSLVTLQHPLCHYYPLWESLGVHLCCQHHCSTHSNSWLGPQRVSGSICSPSISPKIQQYSHNILMITC